MTELSLLEAALKLAASELAIRANAGRALDRIGQLIEDTAKAEFGVYQPETGPFPEWAELAQSTQDERERLGYPADEPLLRDGSTRDSIGHAVGDLELVVGSDSDIMVYHELGTANMPPRPVLGPAAERNHDTILSELGGAVVAGIVGGRPINPSLGYDRITAGD